MAFVHLHNHSEFSLLDGATRVKDLVAKAKEMGMPAVALTDHGAMYGAIDFYIAAKKEGIKPIVGCEVYVAPSGRTSRSAQRKEDSPNHLVLLAKNAEGYKNLMRLVSLGYLEGYYYKPRVDLELLKRYSNGLIAASACLAGRIPQLILNGKITEARDAAIELAEIFGKDHFYIEIQDHGIEEQKTVNIELIKIAEELDLPLVATNDSHYLTKDDARAHDVLLCIQTGSMLDDTKRMKFDSHEFYLKSEDEMRALFPDHPEAFENTLKIADMCELEIELGSFHLPDYQVPEGFTLDSYLEHLCRERIPERYGDVPPEALAERVDFELSVINDMGFPGYFLIVWDFVKTARDMGIAVGPGRGSAAGSVVAYLLGITNVEPLKYGLLFERFLNPSRKTMPDIDIDFDDERRPEIIEYVSKKYGADHVAQIITFGTMKARAATRDAGRVLGVPYGAVDKVAKLISEDTIELSLKKVPELKQIYQKDEQIRQVLDDAMALEGLCRQDSIHAAGVVISKNEITDYAPIQKKGNAETVTQYSMDSITKIGLLKMDFLGLRTLTVLTNAVNIIERTQGIKIDLDDLPPDDPDTFKLYGRGDTVGIFQLESSGMRALLKEFAPSCFEDIIAILALYRPGPLGSGMVQDFVDRKHGRKKIEYLHPVLEPILKETYGVLVYQEQVMQSASLLSGFTMAEADSLRSAISKKNEEVLQQQRAQFIDGGAAKNQVSPERAAEIFDLILHFAGYGFNKSHSTAYAFLSYQAAYLKAHYPAEYMAAALSTVSDDKDKVAILVNDCRKRDMRVQIPDINESYVAFTVINDDAIRFGLSAIRNVGEGVIDHIISIRKDEHFKSFHDFCRRVDLKALNKRTIESLIKAGSFDSLGHTRNGLLENYESVIEGALREQRDRDAGQFNLFDAPDAGSSGVDASTGHGVASLPAIDDEEMDKADLLAYEKEMLGLYVSDHPLIGLEKLIESESDCTIADLKQKSDGSFHWIAGLITKIVSKNTQKGGTMHFVSVEDLESSVEVIVFTALAADVRDLLVEDRLIRIRGRVDQREDEVKLVAQAVEPLSADSTPKRRVLHVKIGAAGDPKIFTDLKQLFLRYSGEHQVIFDIGDNGDTQRLCLGDDFRVSTNNDLMAELLELVPAGTARVAFARGG